MMTTTNSTSAEPTDSARLADLAHDARVLHDDLGVPLGEAVQTVVSDSDFVAQDEREQVTTAVLDRLTD